MVRPREFEEEQVVQDAMHVFWSKGYQATSVQDLVDATGLQRGSLYGAFGDKHGLFVSALDSYADAMVEHVRQLIAAAKDPLDGLRAFVGEVATSCSDPSSSHRGCMVGNTSNELAAHDDVARERVARFVADMQRAMADGLRRAQAQGTFAADRDPDAAATFIQCSVQGLALLAKSRPDPTVIRGVVGEILRALG